MQQHSQDSVAAQAHVWNTLSSASLLPGPLVDLALCAWVAGTSRRQQASSRTPLVQQVLVPCGAGPPSLIVACSNVKLKASHSISADQDKYEPLILTTCEETLLSARLLQRSLQHACASPQARSSSQLPFHAHAANPAAVCTVVAQSSWANLGMPSPS
jgi:hypothetical protein